MRSSSKRFAIATILFTSAAACSSPGSPAGQPGQPDSGADTGPPSPRDGSADSGTHPIKDAGKDTGVKDATKAEVGAKDAGKDSPTTTDATAVCIFDNPMSIFDGKCVFGN